jgi:hypothetical protein
MATDADRYEAWYSYKLWMLLPALYRAEDSESFDEPGPLQELVARIGAEAAIVRRSIDRLWDDQSIETCDDWVINYIGDLLATNLVASLDERGRRVDVGKTIYYRRRKGTLALAEELAHDVTGWTVRVVEQFRRLGRTRHGLDPAIGLPARAETTERQLQRAQGLIGRHTRTMAGGPADLRDVHGANLTDGAFDEYFHTADVRRGRGATGRHNIPRLGVFTWRLHSLGVTGVTAVRDENCPNQYTFDPTGRDVQMFAPPGANFADEWVSPREHQVPGPISADLLRTAFADLYRAQSLFVQQWTGGQPPHDHHAPVAAAEVAPDARDRAGHRFFIDPLRGRTVALAGVDDGQYLVDYCYGFSSEIGAGPYERRVPGLAGGASPIPHFAAITGGGPLSTAFGGSVPAGTVTIGDSRTYTDAPSVTDIRDVEVRAENAQRPLVRSTARVWTFTGVGDAKLTFDGIFLSGPDLVLRGSFERVMLRCCTLDPGTMNADRSAFAKAADDRVLRSVRLRIEGSVRTLVIDRSIVGPIVERGDGQVEKLIARDTIIHSCRPRRPAFSLTGGEVELTRCTILGAAQIHRLEASDSVLSGVVHVDDTQHGCVRFSAWTAGSTLPRQHESVMVSPEMALFSSVSFGRAEYSQLLDSLGSAILEGGEDGTELGAFARESNAVKERSLLIKYQEYLPLGIEPVIVHVT